MGPPYGHQVNHAAALHEQDVAAQQVPADIGNAGLDEQPQHAELDVRPALERSYHLVDAGRRVADRGRQVTDPLAAVRASKADRMLDQVERVRLARLGAQEAGEGEDLTERGHAPQD